MVNQKESAQGASRKIAVLKLGTSTLTDGDGRIDRAFLADLAHQVNRVRASGWKVVIVSSGAVAAGLDEMSLPLVRPKDIPTVQAASSIGQRALSAAYDQVFSPYGIITSLVLLTRRDTADRNAYLHARDTFGRLLDFDVVPIVNENDTVSVEQIKFGDNDTLAALVACLVGADRVVFPERDMGARVAKSLVTPSILDMMELADDYQIAEVRTPSAWCGRTLVDVNVRRNYGLSVLAIHRGKDFLASPGADTMLREGDVLLVLGKQASIDAIEQQ